MSGSSSFKNFFISFGEMTPDGQEFDAQSSETIQNFLPVFSGYRPLLTRTTASTQEAGGPLSGAHVHRSTVPTALDFLQPSADVEQTGDVLTVPSLSAIYEVLRGIFPQDANYVSLYFSDLSSSSYTVDYTLPSKDWDLTGNITFNKRYRAGGQGTLDPATTVEVTSTYGYYDDLDDPITVVTQTSGVIQYDVLSQVFSTSPPIVSSLALWPADIQTKPRKLWAKFEVSGDLVPIQKLWPEVQVSQSGWNKMGASTVIECVDKRAGSDDAIYAYKATGINNTEQITMGMETLNLTSRDNVSFTSRVWCEVDDLSVKLEVLNDGVPISSGTFPIGALDTWVDIIQPVTRAELEAAEPLGVVTGKITVDPQSQVTTTTSNVISSIQSTANWTRYGIGGNLASLRDFDDATGYETSIDIGEPLLAVNWNITDPGAYQPLGSIVHRVRLGNDGTNQAEFFIQLRVASTGTSIHTSTATRGAGSFGTSLFTLTEAEWDLVDDWSTLQTRVYRQGISDNGSISRVAWYELETNLMQNAEYRVSEMYYSIQEPYSVDISWDEAQADITGTYLPGDKLNIYNGEPTKLFTVRGAFYDTWDDVTRISGPYTNTGAYSWDFASWGDQCMATNFIDAVQVILPGDANFRDLIGFDSQGVPIPNYDLDGYARPQARFVASINSFLILANINPDSNSSGRGFSFWCSASGDPTRFALGDPLTLSSLFQLVATPGEITGLVGGEHGYVFKENSVWRADYVGGQQIFNFSSVSKEQGTPYPRSIVTAQNTVYFWGSAGIFAIDRSGELHDISAGKVDKALFDSLFEDKALDGTFSEDVRNNDSKVIGRYDPVTNCIFWSYQQKGDNFHKNNSYLVYNVNYQQYTVLDGVNFETEALIDVGNRQVQSPNVTRSLVQFRFNDSEAQAVHEAQLFNGNATEEGLIKTNTSTAQAIGYKDRNFEINFIRPIFVSEPNSGAPPRMEIEIRYSEIPWLGEFPNFVTVSTDDQNADGWIPVSPPVGAEFLKFNVTIESTPQPNLKEFPGLQIRTSGKGGF